MRPENGGRAFVVEDLIGVLAAITDSVADGQQSRRAILEHVSFRTTQKGNRAKVKSNYDASYASSCPIILSAFLDARHS